MKNGFSDYYKFSNVGADNDCLTADVPCTGEHDCGVVKRVVGTIVDDGFVDDLGELCFGVGFGRRSAPGSPFPYQ
jgi:hypothetical protein